LRGRLSTGGHRDDGSQEIQETSPERKRQSKIVYRVVDEATEDKPKGFAIVLEWLEGVVKARGGE